MTAILLWFKRVWAFLHSNALKIGAAVAALGVVVFAIAKAILARQEKESSQDVRDAQAKHDAARIEDAISVAGTVGEARGEERAAAEQIQEVIETTEPKTEARVDALANELEEMSVRRHREALEAARRKR
jgi:mannitol-specific phosphotransferase system IIBC component